MTTGKPDLVDQVPQYTLYTLLEADPDQERSLIREVPDYFARLEIELTVISKHPRFRGNPFLHSIEDYLEVYGATPLWMRSFNDKSFDIDSEEVEVSSPRGTLRRFEVLDPDNGTTDGSCERELFEYHGRQILVDRHYIDEGYSITTVIVRNLQDGFAYVVRTTEVEEDFGVQPEKGEPYNVSELEGHREIRFERVENLPDLSILFVSKIQVRYMNGLHGQRLNMDELNSVRSESEGSQTPLFAE